MRNDPRMMQNILPKVIFGDIITTQLSTRWHCGGFPIGALSYETGSLVGRTSGYSVKVPVPKFNICVNLHKLPNLCEPPLSPRTDYDYNGT